MAQAVKGKDVVVEMSVDDVYYPILCGTDCEFVRDPEFIEKTTTTSGLFKDFAVRREEWSMSVSGLTKIENSASLTFFYMLQTSVRRTRQLVRITFTDIDGADKQISGYVLIGRQSITGPYSDFANCSIELKGTGAFTIEDVEPPVPAAVEIYSDYWTTTNGQNYIDGSSSGTSPSSVAFGGVFNLGATDTILEVNVEGTEFEIITSGSPGNRECKFNTSTFIISFASDMIFDGTQRVYVEFKRTT